MPCSLLEWSELMFEDVSSEPLRFSKELIGLALIGKFSGAAEMACISTYGKPINSFVKNGVHIEKCRSRKIIRNRSFSFGPRITVRWSSWRGVLSGKGCRRAFQVVPRRNF